MINITDDDLQNLEQVVAQYGLNHVSKSFLRIKKYVLERRKTVRAKRPVQQPQLKICPRCGGTKKVPGPFGGPATFTCIDCDTSQAKFARRVKGKDA